MLDHKATLLLVFRGTSILFSLVAEPIYILVNSVGGFPFSHTLSILIQQVLKKFISFLISGGETEISSISEVRWLVQGKTDRSPDAKVRAFVKNLSLGI